METFLIGIFAAITVFFIKELVALLFFEKIKMYRKIKYDVVERLSYHSNIYTNFTEQLKESPKFNESINEMRIEIRSLSSKVKAFSADFGFHILIPSRKDLQKVCKSLIYISNADNRGQSIDQCMKEVEEIKKIMRLKEFL